MRILNTLAIAITLVVFIPKMLSFPFAPPRPLCLSQFALVNQACAFIPFTLPGPPANTEDPDDPEPDVDVGQHDMPVNGTEHHHDHHHRRRPHFHSAAIEHCCRWLKNLDDACVCELLLRLPPFLRRVTHSYLITVDEDCEIAYKCEGLLS
ncbi:hypothetical protein ACHQM5_027022 [Ranunculus cassubicifolius]